MPALNLQHRRAHNLLLVSKLLSVRDNTSPFTLVIDSLEQSSKPLLREYIRRANIARTTVIYVSFETLRTPDGVDAFVPIRTLDGAVVQRQVKTHISSPTDRNVLLIDSLNTLASIPSINLPTYLSSFISPQTSLLAVYHSDIPSFVPHAHHSTASTSSAYSPHPLTLLKYLSTTILTTHSTSQVLARKAARDRSLAEPLFGIAEENEGVIQGLGSNDRRGLVFEMEYRRRSGRGIREWFFLPCPTNSASSSASSPLAVPQKSAKETVTLLEDYPLYRHIAAIEQASEAGKTREGMDVTFDLGLTEKQRKDREGVVLPYFDAQREDGMGEGGRILYDMGVEDDFDEEEDEI